MIHPCHHSSRALLASKFLLIRCLQGIVSAGYMPIASCIETTDSAHSHHALALPLRAFKFQSYFTRSH